MGFYLDMINEKAIPIDAVGISKRDKAKNFVKKADEVAKKYAQTAIGEKDPVYKKLRASYDKEIDHIKDEAKKAADRGDKEYKEYAARKIKAIEAEFQDELKKLNAKRKEMAPKDESGFI